MARQGITMKKNVLFAAFAVLTVVFYASCDTVVSDTNGPSDPNNPGGPSNPVNTVSKPSALGGSATYSQAIAKLDAIIAYCESSNPVLNLTTKNYAQTYKSVTMPTTKTFWSSVRAAHITYINGLILLLI